MNSLSPLTIPIVFIFGLCFGSFLNVVVFRLPRKMSLAGPSSSCPACRKKLGPADLLPLFSYFLLRGRCRYCGAAISIRYPLVELLCGILFACIIYRFGPGAEALFYLTLLYLLLGVTLIDLEHRIVPNGIVAAGLLAGALFYLPVFAARWASVPHFLLIAREPLAALLGFLVGGAVMLVIFLVSRGGMGAGDIKLAAMIGLYVGLPGIAVVMLIGFVAGALVGVGGMITGRLTRKDALPFAPFLSAAALVEVFFGSWIWNWYINLLS